MKDLESIFLVKNESRKIEEEILKIKAENSYLRSMNADLSVKIALQHNNVSYNCPLDVNIEAEFRKAEVTKMNKTEIFQSPVLIDDKNDLNIEAYESLKSSGHTEEESYSSELPSSELGSAGTVSALSNQTKCRSSADVTPRMPSLISHWLPLFNDRSSNIGNLSSIVSLRAHYVRLPNPGKEFSSLEHVEQEFRELLRAKRRGQDCRQS